MNITAMLTLQSMPFAAIVLATSKDKDFFLLFYVSCLGLILTLVALLGDSLVLAPSVEAMMRTLGSE